MLKAICFVHSVQIITRKRNKIYKFALKGKNLAKTLDRRVYLWYITVATRNRSNGERRKQWRFKWSEAKLRGGRKQLPSATINTERGDV